MHDYGFGNVVLHEIIHAVANVRDFPIGSPPINLTTPGYDYVGDTVRYEQIFADQMGILDRSSYHANIFKDQIGQLDVQLGDSLTGGAVVGVAIVDGSGFDEINTSDRTDNVLLIGMSGDDKITAGPGDDFLYGGNGVDELIRGVGSDQLYGNADNDILIAGNKIIESDNPFGFYAESDGIADQLEGGAGNDKYYTSQHNSYEARALVDYNEGPFNFDALNFVDSIVDSDGLGVIYGATASWATDKVIGDRALTFHDMGTSDGVTIYETVWTPSTPDDQLSGYHIFKFEHEGAVNLAFASGETNYIDFVVKNWSAGDFGITLAA